MLVNKTKLAEILGKSQPTITTWQKQGLPIAVSSERGKSYQYDTKQVIEWLIQKEISKLTIGGSLDLTSETARLKHHQANNEALKEAQLKGELIPAELIVEFGSHMVVAAKAKLLAIHSKIRSKFSSISQETINEIQRFHHEALDELGTDGIPSEIRESIRKHIKRLDSTA